MNEKFYIVSERDNYNKALLFFFFFTLAIILNEPRLLFWNNFGRKEHFSECTDI